MIKLSKPWEDPNSSKETDKIIIANEHLKDTADVTQYDSNFPKELVFGKVHYRSFSNRKVKSRAKTDKYSTIKFKRGVNDVSNRKQRNRAHVLLNYFVSYG